MNKLINETLKTGGKWSIKRLQVFSSFWISVIYAFIPAVIHSFIVNDFVFFGFIGLSGGSTAMTVWNKIIDKKQPANEEPQ